MPRSRESTVQEMQRDGIADARGNATPSERLSRDVYRFEDVRPERLIGGAPSPGEYARTQMETFNRDAKKLYDEYGKYHHSKKFDKITEDMKDANKLYYRYRRDFGTTRQGTAYTFVKRSESEDLHNRRETDIGQLARNEMSQEELDLAKTYNTDRLWNKKHSDEEPRVLSDEGREAFNKQRFLRDNFTRQRDAGVRDLEQVLRGTSSSSAGDYDRFPQPTAQALRDAHHFLLGESDED